MPEQPRLDASLAEIEHVGQLLEQRAWESAEAVALRFEREVLTYLELEERTHAVAGRLAASGVAPGDRVAVMAANLLDYVLVWLGLGRLGAVAVGVNTGHKTESLEHILVKSEVSTAIVDPDLHGEMDAVADRVDRLRQVFTGINDLADDPRETFPVVRAGDAWMHFFTSGTTGLPKAVEFSHRYALNMASDVAECARLSSDAVTYTCFPLYHAEAPLCNLLPVLLVGGTGALGVRFSASRFWDEIRSHDATSFTHLGSIVAMLDKQPPTERDLDNPVTRSFGFPTPPNWRDIQDRFGLKLFEWGGSSEAGILTAESMDEEHRDGCSGRPLWHSEVRLFDEQDREVGPGEVGEMVSRPRRRFGMMTGYAGDPEATARAFRNLWFRSGDLGVMEADGMLRYAGRRKEMIRRRGVNISPLEVEQALAAHAEVVDVAAIGIPSELGEEELKVVIQLAPNAEISVDEVILFAGSRLPQAMLPRYVEFVDNLPRTTTGKVQKASLKDPWRTSTTFDRESQGLLS